MEDNPDPTSAPPPDLDTSTENLPDSAPPDAPRRPAWWSGWVVAAVLLVALIVAVVIAVGDNRQVEVVEGANAVSSAGPDGVEAIDVSNFPAGALAGQPAPDLAFPLFDGTEFSLVQHFAQNSQPLVLNLWASWCGPCRQEIPAFSQAAINNPQVAFVGVAVQDNRSSAEEFAAEIGASYPLGIEGEAPVVNQLPFFGLPTTYLFAADGTVVRQLQGEITQEVLQAFIDHDF